MNTKRPLRIASLVPDGGSGADGSTIASYLGRLNCLPWPIQQVPGNEHWWIERILVKNWSVVDAIYSISVEHAAYDRGSNAGGANISRATPGLRYGPQPLGVAATGSYPIAWGDFIGAGKRQIVEVGQWAMPTEWYCTGAIPGYTSSPVTMVMSGWAYS